MAAKLALLIVYVPPLEEVIRRILTCPSLPVGIRRVPGAPPTHKLVIGVDKEMIPAAPKDWGVLPTIITSLRVTLAALAKTVAAVIFLLVFD